MLVGYFIPSIGAFAIEFIINKSNNRNWGYKITKTIFILNVALLIFIYFQNQRGDN